MRRCGGWRSATNAEVALAPLYFGVFLNVGVALGVLALFSIPLLRGIGQSGLQALLRQDNG